nr:hypothetical protein [Tanacetum cinerariifolium]
MITPPTTETPIITPTIPPSPDYTPASLDYSLAFEADDTPDTPPSPTHDTPFTEITDSTQRSPVIPRRQVMILSLGQSILHEDIPEPAQEGASEVTYETLGDLVKRGTASVESQRVDRLQRGMSPSMTHEEVEELIARRVAEEIEAREVARNLKALNENEEEQEGEN